jgi:hypothetical protein
MFLDYQSSGEIGAVSFTHDKHTCALRVFAVLKVILALLKSLLSCDDSGDGFRGAPATACPVRFDGGLCFRYHVCLMCPAISLRAAGSEAIFLGERLSLTRQY